MGWLSDFPCRVPGWRSNSLLCRARSGTQKTHGLGSFHPPRLLTPRGEFLNRLVLHIATRKVGPIPGRRPLSLRCAVADQVAYGTCYRLIFRSESLPRRAVIRKPPIPTTTNENPLDGCSMTRSDLPQIVLTVILLSLIGLSVSGLLAIAQGHSNTMQVAR